MASPKSGTAGSAVTPADADQAQEADNADPGAVEAIKAQQLQTKSGKYGSVQGKPFKPPKTKAEKKQKTGWIAITLVDEAGKCMPGEQYEITLPNGEVATGTLDEKGAARIDGIESGQCQVGFPNLENDQWRKG